MIRNRTVFAAFAGLVVALGGAQAGFAQQLTLTPFKAGGIYARGEKVGWTVTAPEGAAALARRAPLVSVATNVAGAAGTTTWQDNYTTRLEALALLQSLNADLLSHDSATLTLDRWCGSHRLASPAHVVADRVRDADKQPTAEQRRTLGVSDTEPVRYRRVQLRCGERVLSEAENWYVPARLTPEMNRSLDTTDVAFGRVVRNLRFRRQTLSATLLWSPLPQGWEMGEPVRAEGASTLQIPRHVLQHHAVLVLPDGTPISQLVETYTSEVLAFPEPARARAALP